MGRLILVNTDESGNAKCVLAGYYKYYLASFFNYGSSGTCIVYVYEDDTD